MCSRCEVFLFVVTGISVCVLITKIDQMSKAVEEDLPKVYRRVCIENKIEDVATLLEVSQENVFVMKVHQIFCSMYYYVFCIGSSSFHCEEWYIA